MRSRSRSSSRRHRFVRWLAKVLRVEYVEIRELDGDSIEGAYTTAMLDEAVGYGPFHIEALGDSWHLQIGDLYLNIYSPKCLCAPLDFASWYAAHASYSEDPYPREHRG